jgi:hypothetical protein
MADGKAHAEAVTTGFTPQQSRMDPQAEGGWARAKEQKIIRAKVGLLELARQLGNVSQACK